MLKRELKINFKSFVIWTGILIILFFTVFMIYPSIISSDNIKMLNEMMEIFPPEILKAFNMDISTIDSAFGFLKTEGFVFILLLTGVYSSILGSNILLKEESDKTIEYLNTLPIKRSAILLKKVMCAVIYIVLMVIVVGIFNYIGLSLSGDFNREQYMLLSVIPLLSSLPLFAINLFLSTLMSKAKNTFGLGLGVALCSYFLQILAELSNVTEFFKYFTVYTLADVRNVIINVSINPLMVIISIIITVLFIVGSLVKYENKELV